VANFTPHSLYALLSVGDWEGPRAHLDAVAKRMIFPAPTGNQTTFVQSVA